MAFMEITIKYITFSDVVGMVTTPHYIIFSYMVFLENIVKYIDDIRLNIIACFP